MLITMAFDIGENVIIGVSSDKFVKQSNKPHSTASYEQRVNELQKFLKQHGVIQRAKIIPIDDPYGGILLSNSPIEALVVSKETEPTAAMINEKRKKTGINPLRIVVVEMVPSENHGVISTTRIHNGEIDREGHLLNRKSCGLKKPKKKIHGDNANYV